MAQNYVQPGDTLTQIAPSGGTISGNPYLFGTAGAGKVMVALQTKAAGAEVECATTGVYRLAKTAALAIAAGDIVYLDTATKLINKTSASNNVAGFASKASAGAEGFVEVKLTP